MYKLADEKKKNVNSPLTTWMKRRRLIARLSMLDDRMLDDIGFQRFQINHVAEKAFPRIGLKASVAAIMASIRKNLKRRSSARELAALDDRMLADIGIQRSEIPGAIRGDLPFRAFAVPSIISTPKAKLVHSVPDLAPVPAPVNDDAHSIAA